MDTNWVFDLFEGKCPKCGKMVNVTAVRARKDCQLFSVTGPARYTPSVLPPTSPVAASVDFHCQDCGARYTAEQYNDGDWSV